MSHEAGKDGETATVQEARYSLFVGLLARNDLAIRRFVRSLLPSTEDVDDVIQETALECWKKFSDFTPEDPDAAFDDFIRWACVIARYKALSWQRDRSRDRLVFRESVIEHLAATAMEHLDERDIERQAVECCLQKIPDEHRRLVLSVHSPGQSIALIAAKSGEKARRLYSRVNGLRKQLLECVQQQLAGEIGHG